MVFLETAAVALSVREATKGSNSTNQGPLYLVACSRIASLEATLSAEIGEAAAAVEVAPAVWLTTWCFCGRCQVQAAKSWAARQQHTKRLHIAGCGAGVEAVFYSPTWRMHVSQPIHP